MALSQSALSELLEAIRAGGSADVMRDAMTLVLQQLIELEADQAIGAARYERTDARTTHRNGVGAGCSARRRVMSSCASPSSGPARSSRRSWNPDDGSTGPSGPSSWRPMSTASARARSTTW
jgi:hypothetical protein